MKKTLILFLGIILTATTYAQIADSSQRQAAVIDSLAMRLKNLQHDFDYLSADYELHKVISNITSVCMSIDVLSNSIIINYNSKNYDRSLLKSYSDLYDTYRKSFEDAKDLVGTTLANTSIRMRLSDFTNEEHQRLKSSMHLMEMTMGKYEQSLELLETSIKAYKSLR